MTRPAKREGAALESLAHAGATRAAEAFAMLMGRAVELGPSRVVAGRRSKRDDDPAATGVFFELEGCLDAAVAIVFPGQASDAVVRRIVGIETGDLDETIVESALMEIGNILASHVASAIADELGDRLLPSIPALAMCAADEALDAFLADRIGNDLLRIETPLLAEDGQVLGALVLVSEARDLAESDSRPGRV